MKIPTGEYLPDATEILIEEAPPPGWNEAYEPPPEQDNGDPKPPSPQLTFRQPNHLLGLSFDDSDCILGDRLLATGQPLVISGAGGIGKSRLLLQMAVAHILSRDFISLSTHAPKLTWLIIQAENSNRRLQEDLLALKKWAGDFDWQLVQDHLFIHTLETDADNFLSLKNHRAAQLIADSIKLYHPDIVGWDSLYNFAIGDLNHDEDMAATVLAISRITHAENPKRCPVVLHHALTGKIGAARATGYDRSSFARNSKVLHSWARGQINLAPASPNDNESLIVSCGKCSNGKEFAAFGIKLNPQTMIYEPDPDIDVRDWEDSIQHSGGRSPAMSPQNVANLCQDSKLSRPQLAKAITEECGCARQSAYKIIAKAEKFGSILFSKPSNCFYAKSNHS